MQSKTTKLTVSEDCPTASSNKRYGANINVIAFNTDLIAEQDPLFAVQLMKLHRYAMKFKKNGPRAPKEEFQFAAIQLQGMVGRA